MAKEITWNENKIKEGFQKFFNEYGRYPMALEVDNYPFLPSSRQIQRRFGGLPSLRRLLGLKIQNYGKGRKRSETADLIGNRSLRFENNIKEFLICVHEQKHFNNTSKKRLDFFVYAKNRKFGVDVFYPKDYHSFVGCINSKMKNYTKTIFEIILVQINSSLSDHYITVLTQKKKTEWNPLIKIMTEKKFLDFISFIDPLKTL